MREQGCFSPQKSNVCLFLQQSTKSFSLCEILQQQPQFVNFINIQLGFPYFAACMNELSSGFHLNIKLIHA